MDEIHRAWKLSVFNQPSSAKLIQKASIQTVKRGKKRLEQVKASKMPERYNDKR